MKDFNIENPTHQEMFDHVYLALKLQKSKSFNEKTNYCRYYIKDETSGKELRCAIGHLLSKERAIEWSRVVGGISILLEKNVKHDFVPDWMWLEENKKFLCRLQHAHDKCSSNYFVYDFEANAQKFAKYWNLTIPELLAIV